MDALSLVGLFISAWPSLRVGASVIAEAAPQTLFHCKIRVQV